MRVALLVGGGMGDAIQLLPLVKMLLRQEHHVDIIGRSRWDAASFYEMLRFERLKVYKLDNINSFFRYVLKPYDQIFIDRNSASWLNILVATLIGKRVKVNRNMSFSRFLHLKFASLIQQVHNLIQPLRLLDPELNQIDLNRDFYLDKGDYQIISRRLLEGRPYIILQAGSGNDPASVKNWPVGHWIQFLRHCEIAYPDWMFALVGDANEMQIGKEIAVSTANTINLVGRTSFEDLFSLVAHANSYVGHDSGVMHLAAVLRKRTFTLWGPSDPDTIGYGIFEPVKHHDVSLRLRCAPCLSLINPNRTRVSTPQRCPDRKCLSQLDLEFVARAFKSFLEP